MQVASNASVRLNVPRGALARQQSAAWLAPLLILCAGAAVRLVPLLARYPLHRDEALYGYWARLIASGSDPLLLTAWVDKPPFAIYLMAACLRAFGASEIALRIPGMVAGVACIPLAYGLARRAYEDRTALLAALLVAASPFAILFSPTAFTDPWLTLWLVAAAWAALAGKGFLAGVAAGLAVASKQQGVLAVPLVLALLALLPASGKPGPGQDTGRFGRRPSTGTAHRRWRRPPLWRRFGAALAGFLLVFGPLTYWDSLRWARRPSFWGRGLETYGGLGLAPVGDWPRRAVAWAGQLAMLYGPAPLSAGALALALLPAPLAYRALRRRDGRGPSPLPAQQLPGPGDAPIHPKPGLAQRADLVFGLYMLGYLGVYQFLTFQPWDRYLLPLLPLVAVLAARGASLVGDRIGHAPRFATGRALAVAALAGLLAWAAWQGAAGRLPVGSDHGAYEGLDRVAAFVRARPADARIYHHSLGWYFDYYLFDAPQDRVWWDSDWKLASLAARAARTAPGREQWLILNWTEDGDRERIARALANWGLLLSRQAAITRRDGSQAFAVYRIVPAARQAWR